MLENVRIVADSSSDLMHMDQVDYASVPLKITAGDYTWADDEGVNLDHMLETLKNHKGPSSSACPSPDEWRRAFGHAQHVFCITITSGLSGCYNSASLAARQYQEDHPERRVHVIDSLSAGPELALIAHKLAELCRSSDSFDMIVREITAYQKRTHLTFALQSLHNFVANGRISPVVGAMVGMLGIRIVGVASEEGTLQPVAKCRSDRKAIAEIVKIMKERGFNGGKVIIDHCRNLDIANTLKAAILGVWEDARVSIGTTRALCSFYAEEGGMLVGFETV